MKTSVVSIIVGMFAVTYLPRLLPGLLYDYYRLPKRVEKWLQNVPYAALGALIFPGIIQGQEPVAGFVSGLVAIGLGLLGLDLITVMVVTVFVAFVVSQFL